MALSHEKHNCFACSLMNILLLFVASLKKFTKGEKKAEREIDYSEEKRPGGAQTSRLWLYYAKPLAHLLTALIVALRPPFLIRQAQYAQVFPLKPAPSMLFDGLSSTSKSTISFLFSFSRTLALSFPPYLNLSGRSARNCLLALCVPSGYNGSPNTRFSREPRG